MTLDQVSHEWNPERHKSRLDFGRYALLSASAVILIALMGLAGWVSHSEFLIRVVPGYGAMNPTTSVCLLILSAGLVVRIVDSTPNPPLSSVCALGCIAVGAACLVEYATDFDIGIDRIFLATREAKITELPSGMGMSTALCFVLSGLALLLLDKLTRRGWWPSQGLAALTGYTGGLVLVDATYDVGALQKVSAEGVMAVHTALAFVLFASGLLLARPGRGLLAVLMCPVSEIRLMRRLLLGVMLVPPVLGAVRLIGERRGLYTTEFGIALMVVCMMGVIGFIFSVTLFALHDVSIRRERAEHSLQFANHELEERVLKRTEELTRSNTELEQFAYVASHDLQQPLRMVASYVQLIELNYKNKLSDEANEFIHFAVDGAERMKRLINDLLSVSRVGAQRDSFAPVDSAAVVSNALRLLEVTIRESDAKVTFSSLPTVMGNETQLEQLFQNLIGNAIKYRSERPPVIRVSAARQNHEWMFSISDNGIGIEARHADRIFHLFQRLHSKEEYPGTGIGLALCKKIVEHHGGRIWVESTPADVTTFFFTIPYKEISSVDECASVTNNRDLVGGGRRR